MIAALRSATRTSGTDMVEVTRHAEKRMHERLGLPRKAMKAEAERAASRGIHISETTGRLRKYLDLLHITYRTGSDYRITPSGIYVITDGVLVTVLPVPQNLRTAIMGAWRNKQKEKEAA